MNDNQIINDFIGKLQQTVTDTNYLKNTAIAPSNIPAIALCNNMITRLQSMEADVIELQRIEERYKNATDIWML